MKARLLTALAAALAGRLLAAEAPAPALDGDISRMMTEISPERIQRSIYVLASFKTRNTLSDPLPSGDGIGGAKSWIKAEFGRAASESGGRLKVALDTYDQHPDPPRIPAAMQLTNIVATLPGTDPDGSGRTLVVCGHIDSVASSPLDATGAAPGADDDASGVAAVLEMAHVMAHYRFPATIVFLTVSGEEQNIDGSTHWAKAAKEHATNIEAVLNNDIIGSSRSPSGKTERGVVRLFAEGVRLAAAPDDALQALLRTGGENDSPTREIARSVRDIAAAYVPSVKVRVVYRTDRYRRGGDHMAFLEQGYPAVRFTEPVEDFRHQHQDVREEKGVMYGDLPENLDYSYIANVTRINAASLAVLARAPAPPSATQIEAVKLEADTTLRWAPSKEPNLAGYRIVWRETTAPFWEHSVDVQKDVNRVTLPGISKDDFIFGVEAFDASGNTSPASYPTARKTL
jgi:Peptidase family M28